LIGGLLFRLSSGSAMQRTPQAYKDKNRDCALGHFESTRFPFSNYKFLLSPGEQL
jgi:hypothetical protein